MKKIYLLICAMAVVTAASAQVTLQQALQALPEEQGDQLNNSGQQSDVRQQSGVNYWETLRTTASQMPLIDIHEPFLPESGLKLSKTTKVDEMKCEVYKGNDSFMRVIYKENGDFFTTSTRKGVPPSDDLSVESWRMTGENVYYCSNSGFLVIQFPNGNQEYWSKCNIRYDHFKRDYIDFRGHRLGVRLASDGLSKFYAFADPKRNIIFC